MDINQRNKQNKQTDNNNQINQIQSTLPQYHETIKIIKSDCTFEKQYDTFISFDLYQEHNSEIETFIQKVLNLQCKPLNQSLQKSLGCFLGSALGDSLGQYTDGHKIDYQRSEIQGFYSHTNDLRVPKGLYSDDTSLALCIADSLIQNKYVYNAQDLRHRFTLWWYFGLNNGKQQFLKISENDKNKILSELRPAIREEFDLYSFGIGVTMFNSIINYIRAPSQPYCDNNFGNQNANGSIMRIAPIPITFRKDPKLAGQIAYEQSRTTHNGEEAAECCKLLSFIVANIIQTSDSSKTDFEQEEKNRNKSKTQQILDQFSEAAMQELNLQNKSVISLAQSQQEEFSNKDIDNYNQVAGDRCWDWKNEQFQYSPTRSQASTSGIGAYVMDCLCMSLHIVYHTKNFKEAILKSVNLGGDADTVSAVVGLLAGAVYGLEDDIVEIYQKYIQQWDQNKIIIRVFQLYYGKQ